MFDKRNEYYLAEIIVSDFKHDSKISKAHKALSIIFIVFTIVFYAGNVLTTLLISLESGWGFSLVFSLDLFLVFMVFFMFTVVIWYFLSFMKCFKILSLSKWITTHQIDCREALFHKGKDYGFLADAASVCLKPIRILLYFAYAFLTHLIALIMDIFIFRFLLSIETDISLGWYSSPDFILSLVFINLLIGCIIAMSIVKRKIGKKDIDRYINSF